MLLVNRSEYLDHLRRLCDEQAPALRAFVKEGVPLSFLAYALSEGHDLLDAVVDETTAATGVLDSLQRSGAGGTMSIAHAFHPTVMARCGIGSLTIRPMPSRAVERLEEALEVIRKRFSDPIAGYSYARIVSEWASLAAYVEFSPETKGDAFSSAGFPETQGLIYLSRFVSHHIPPETTFREPSVYAHCENLIHESLHHYLGGLFAMDAVFTTEAASTEPTVTLSWRDVRFSVEKAIQTMWVYKHVANLRKAASRDETFADQAAALDAASIGAHACAAELSSALRASAGEHLTAAGRAVLDDIAAM